jgi:hypothetical protein
MAASNGTRSPHSLLPGNPVDLPLPWGERVSGDAWPLYSQRGSFLGWYPPRVHAHMQVALEREVRGFERLAGQVGVTGRRLNGWFKDYSGKERMNENLDYGCCRVHWLAPGR